MKCKAKTAEGKRCTFNAVIGGYCIKHYKIHSCKLSK